MNRNIAKMVEANAEIKQALDNVKAWDLQDIEVLADKMSALVFTLAENYKPSARITIDDVLNICTEIPTVPLPPQIDAKQCFVYAMDATNRLMLSFKCPEGSVHKFISLDEYQQKCRTREVVSPAFNA